VLQKKITERPIALASNSPRRRELLKLIVPEFETFKAPNVDETYPADLPIMEVAPYLSRLKAEACLPEIKDDTIVITADTVVIVDNIILGKPKDAEEARRMLRLLSGRTHKVVTGFTLTSADKSMTDWAYTLVTFGRLTDGEINEYVDNFKPLDKAGAYGIQEWIGCIGIKRIVGCYYNVMGLPLHKLYKALREFVS
jgi:septum formation protein